MKLLPTLLLALSTLLPLTLTNPSPDRLNGVLQSAAKAANASPKPASSRKPGAVPSPAKPATPNLSGLGIVGAPNYAEKCRAKNVKMAKVIETFCGLQRIEVPSGFTSKGWCGYGGRDMMNAQVDSAFGGEKVWCVKVGSKKGKCKPTTLDKKKCMGKLMEVCAKGGKRGVGKARDGECFVYQTGFYDGLAADAEISPFRGAAKPAGY
ncbi:hypothetical protein M409DRAFT_22913 [Zasmidium cellare ATCC 36951]|uniref:Ecp2 effector protein domain-containing protein n=1 Tax=Zasmidium cellare ATCC 36951 TaxID=1080233 RepID=A0A6A6CL20_ZASCE|nr:uncharacterized protein M409DRAFT_22913 [Zasmidium cellare ATCC 36951]KAF2166860.1 hypothetical protein M409DRAFT_22913 [Zasmidium cellare ATCC 36951]